MVQASEAWRANLRAEYILSQVGGRGRRRCGGEEDSDQRCQARCPAIFISKIFSQKIWPKNWGGSSNRKFREWFVCGSGPAPPRPPFRQIKNTPVGLPRGADFPGAAFGPHWVGRLVTSFMPGSATFLPHLTIRLPAYDAIAGVEAWAAGGIWRSAEWAFRRRISWRAGPGCGCNYQPMRRCGAACGYSAASDEFPCDFNDGPRRAFRQSPPSRPADCAAKTPIVAAPFFKTRACVFYSSVISCPSPALPCCVPCP